MDIHGLRPYLERAKSFIAKNEQHYLVYAALELRYCFEMIAYSQLELYREIPAEIAREWKPDQLIRALAEFDQDSDVPAELSISLSPVEETLAAAASNSDNIEYLHLGKAERIEWRLFRRLYNSLGSYLHLSKDQQPNYPSLAKLGQIVDQLEAVANSTIKFAKTEASTVVCRCKTLLVIGPKQMSGERPIFCSNTKCNAILSAVKGSEDRQIYLVEQIQIACPCGAQVPFQRDAILSPTRCPNCKATLRARVAAVALATPSD